MAEPKQQIELNKNMMRETKESTSMLRGSKRSEGVKERGKGDKEQEEDGNDEHDKGQGNEQRRRERRRRTVSKAGKAGKAGRQGRAGQGRAEQPGLNSLQQGTNRGWWCPWRVAVKVCVWQEDAPPAPLPPTSTAPRRHPPPHVYV